MTLQEFIADIQQHPERLKQEEVRAQAEAYFEEGMQYIQQIWAEVQDWCTEQGITTDELLAHLS